MLWNKNIGIKDVVLVLISLPSTIRDNTQKWDTSPNLEDQPKFPGKDDS